MMYENGLGERGGDQGAGGAVVGDAGGVGLRVGGGHGRGANPARERRLRAIVARVGCCPGPIPNPVDQLVAKGWSRPAGHMDLLARISTAEDVVDPGRSSNWDPAVSGPESDDGGEDDDLDTPDRSPRPEAAIATVDAGFSGPGGPDKKVPAGSSAPSLPVLALGPDSTDRVSPPPAAETGHRVPDQGTAEHLDVLFAMEVRGGGFVSALAAAWRRADWTNHAALYREFGHYYRSYALQLSPKATRGAC